MYWRMTQIIEQHRTVHL